MTNHRPARLSRRAVLKAGAGFAALRAAPPAAAAPQATAQGPRVVVIGAGAFGGWTALHLQSRGARVTLLDAWGPGHQRSSSGGETRIIRSTYGPHRPYYKLV